MKQKVVVLGGGFLGVNAALDLARKEIDVILVDKDLTHEYIPGTIDLIRSRFSECELQVELEEFLPGQIETRQEEVVDVRPGEGTVETGQSLISYDKLVVGLGGQPANYGLDISNAEHVWGLEPAKKLSEKANEAESAIIVGGGYVGIEVAGELAEKNIDTTILDASTRPLSYLNEKASEKILEILNKKDVKFKGDRRATEINENSVKVNGKDEKLEADLIIWAGGVQANETVQKSFEVDGKGLKVNKGLSVVEHEDVFAGGDAADITGQKTAHKAMDQGSIIAENIGRGKTPLEQSEEEQKFLLASIGNTAAFIYKDKVLLTSRLVRYMKDFVKIYYFSSLKLKKKLINVGFLP